MIKSKNFPLLVVIASLGVVVGTGAYIIPRFLIDKSISTSIVENNQNRDTTQQLLTAYGEALSNPTRVQNFLDNLTDNVTWRMTGDRNRLLYSGEYRGRSGVETFFTNMARTFIWTEFTPLDVLVEETTTLTGQKETRVAARVKQTGKGTFTGRELQQDFVYMFTVGADGRIRSFEGFYNTYSAAATATGVKAPTIPKNDQLTGEPATIDRSIDSKVTRRVATENWQALIAGNLQQFSELNAPDAKWSFAVGGPDFLPFVQAAQGITSDQKPLKSDYSNAGPVITQILQPRQNVLQQGNLAITETLVDGNRVLVRLRETGATVLETGNRYDLDILSWMTVNSDGKIASNQVIVDTYPTVDALRPGAMFPLPVAEGIRHYPAFYVTGSRVNGIVVTYDKKGNYTGILGQANPTDSELVQPSAITYGPDGKLYVTSSSATERNQGNAVLVYDGVSGAFQGVFGEANNAQSGLLNPTGIKFGPDGNLYVASAYKSQILRYDGATGKFLGVYATRDNGNPNNIVPEGQPPDFTVLVFGPDGHLYVTSLLENAVLRYAGPKSDNPGKFLGTYGEASGNKSEINQPRAIAFGPDANLYVASAGTGRILKYASPLEKNAGKFLGVYADVGREVAAESDISNMDFNGDGTTDAVVQSGLGFAPDGNLYVSSSIEITQPPANMPTNSQVRIYAGPKSTNPGKFLGVFGQASTENSRILLPTTPEFTYTENNFPQTKRFDNIFFVVGNNTDRPVSAEGIPGFFLSDNTDALAAYDRNMKFLGFLGKDLIGKNNPINGIGGVTIAPNGNIIVASQLSNQVLEFSSLTGNYLGVFGDADPKGTGDNPNTPENEGLRFPAGITVGPDNNIYVADLGNKRILKFNGYTGKLLDDPKTPENEGIVVQLTDQEEVRFTDLAFGPDGRIYIGFNPPLQQPALGKAEVRVYRPDGVLETKIVGPSEQPLDFVAALDVTPDNRLYIGDDSASMANPENGQMLAPGRESRLLIYEINNVHPLVTNLNTGQGDPSGVRTKPKLVNQFQVGVGNAGGLTVGEDGIIYLSEPLAGRVSKYNDKGKILGTLPDFRLPDAALQAQNGVDADGKPRPTGSIFLTPLQ